MTVSRRKAAGEAQGVTHVPPRPDISRAARSARSGRWRFGFWILDFGFWILDFGFWILDFGFWILDFGFWILDYSRTGTLP
jgi:hypothetical protein